MMASRKSWKTLFTCNVIHIVVGLLSMILALIQFSPVALDNASLIDFRLLNLVHTLTGAVGLHMILKNFGSVVCKSLYCLSFVLSLWTLTFYADTLAQENLQFESMREIRRLDGGQELVTDETIRNHIWKLVLCSLMILLSVTEIVTSVFSFVILERLVNDRETNFGLSNLKLCSKSISGYAQNRRRRQQMAFVALMKIACASAVLCLGSYLEALYKKRTGFVKIGWHILTGSIILLGACIDLRALYGGGGWNLLNLKISLIFSIASAVLSAKTLDYVMSNYFVADVREYSRYDELKLELQIALNGVQVNAEGDKREAFVKFVVHAAIVGSLVLSFAHCVISAVEASSYLEKNTASTKIKQPPSTKISSLENSRTNFFGANSGVVPATNFRYHPSSNLRLTSPTSNIGDDTESEQFFLDYDERLHKSKTCSGIFQCICGLALISLCVISLVSWDFSRGYDGGVGVLWLGCVFIASGLINANRPKTFTTSVYVLSVISSVLSFERTMYSLNVIYQAARNSRFQAELDPTPSDSIGQQSNYNAHTGRIVLYSIEASVMLLEFLSSTFTCFKFTQSIRSMPRSIFTQSKDSATKSKGALCSLGIFHLLYAFVTISVSIAAEVALWSYNVHVSYLVYSTNGVVVFAAVFVQWLASQHGQFLLPSAIMNVVTASVAFFVLAPAIRDLYTLVAGYRSVYENLNQRYYDVGQGSNEILDAELRAKPVQEWIIGMNALIVLLAIVEYAVSIVSGMICSYLLHHAYEPRNADLRIQSLANQLPRYWSAGLDTNRIYRRSNSIDGSMIGGDRFLPHVSKTVVDDRRFVNDDFYGQRSMHSLSRVVYPTVSATNNAMHKSNANCNQPHYGSLPSILYGEGMTNGRGNNYGSLTVERGGANRYAYY